MNQTQSCPCSAVLFPARLHSPKKQRCLRYFLPALVVNSLCSNLCSADQHKPSFVWQLQKPLEEMKQLRLTFPYRHQQQHDQCCADCFLICIINLNWVVTWCPKYLPSAVFPCTSPQWKPEHCMHYTGNLYLVTWSYGKIKDAYYKKKSKN